MAWEIGAYEDTATSNPPVWDGVFAPPTATEDESYSYATSGLFSGGTVVSYDSAQLPANGLDVNSTTGLISGTPTSDADISGVVIVATNADGNDETDAATIVVNSATVGDTSYLGSNLILKEYIGAVLITAPAIDPGEEDPAITGDILPITQNRTGFTRVSLAADSRVVYVSESTGSNSNDGLSTSAPVETIAEGLSKLRDGYPDWLCLKAGDTWDETISDWNINGRSSTERAVLTSYGVGTERPKIVGSSGIVVLGAETSLNYLAVYGIHFYCDVNDPNSPNYSYNTGGIGIRWLIGGTGLLFEDNVFDMFEYGLSLSSANSSTKPISNVIVRRNLFTNNYTPNPSEQRGEGFYSASVNNLLVEENIADHSGWNDDNNTDQNIYGHNFYIQHNNQNVTFKNNISMRAGSHGIQLRCGGTCDNNFFIENSISLLFGSDYTNPYDELGYSGDCTNNVLLNGTDMVSVGSRGYGVAFNTIKSCNFEDNVVSTATSTSSGAYHWLEGYTGVSYTNNRSWKWPQGDDDSGKSYVAPDRSIASYSTSIGGAGTFADFISNVLDQGMRSGWDTDYDVSSINPYFVAGVQDS